MKDEKIEQPFTLNHEGNSLAEIFNITQDEALAAGEENIRNDIPFGILLMNVLSENQEIGAVVATILSGVLGTDLDKPSKVVEYVVRTIQKGEGRDLVLTALCFVDEDKIMELKKAETMLGVLKGLKEEMQK